MKLIKNQEFYENIKKKYRLLKTLFSILSILTMLIYPVFSILTKRGNLYINITILVISIIYGIVWLALGSNKKYKMNRIYKWSRLLLSAVSLGINIYSVYITMTNFSVWSVIITTAMMIFWLFNVAFNILYDIASYKLNKFITQKKEDFNTFKDNLLVKIKGKKEPEEIQ